VKLGEINDLIQKAGEIRNLTIDELAEAGVGHVGGCLSIVEVLTVLYYRFMKVDANEPKMKLRDRLVLSKGHAGPALYAALAHKGFFDKSLLSKLNKPGTILPSHCDMLKTTGIDMTTGSLGQGFSCAVGMAAGSKIKQDQVTIYTIIGDGESQEGQIWEAAMYAGSHKLDNIIAFTDYNKMQIDGTTDEIVSLSPLDKKWEAFGWHVINVEDGHNMEEISCAIEAAKVLQGKPSMIILNTIKGKGLKCAEKAGVANHNMPITREMVDREKQKALVGEV
jgi:transketolase